MANYTVEATPLLSLVRELRDETKALIQQEVRLAKTEISEKVSHFGKNAVALAVGGFVAYAGLIVFLAGLGALIALGLVQAGVDQTLATFAGLAIIGLLVALAGAAFILKALKTFKGESLSPERTVHTLHQLAGSERGPAAPPEPAAPPKQSSEQLEQTVQETQTMVGERMEELGRRMTPHYMNEVIKGQVRSHPVRYLLAAFGTGLAGAFLVVRRWRHAHA